MVHLISPDEIAAIVVEPIQGEGGYLVPPKSFLQGLRALTSEHGIALVCDEVQSGMGRTGKMFALEHFGLEADVVNIAKGIASGLPLGITCAQGRHHVVASRARTPARSAATRCRAPRHSRRSSC